MKLPLWTNVIALVALVAVGAWILAQLFPPTRAVRLRNAFLAKRGDAAAFDWTPQNVPGEFRREHAQAYEGFRAAIAELRLNDCVSDWERALRIAEHLIAHTRDLGPIQSDLETTYVKIRQGYGYCADFVRVFLGLAHAAGLFVRQWAFAFDGFGGHGHTFVEVFDPARGKWCLLDVHNNIHARAVDGGEPLSALTFRTALSQGTPAFRIVANGAGRLGFPIEEKLLAYWRRGLQEWYLIDGNAVFSYEARPLIRWTSRISGPLGQIVATCTGVHPPIRVLLTPDNTERVHALERLKRCFLAAVIGCLVLAALLAAQGVALGKATQITAG